jgi:hypothetical protein
MNSTSVFDRNVLTPTGAAPDTRDSHVVSLKTEHTVGTIDSLQFLVAKSAAGGAQALSPGAEQILVQADDQASYTYGNLSVFINGSPVQGSPQPDAYELTVGGDRQTLIQGVDLSSGKNQTSFKQEYWDTQTTTNMDQVKESYFVSTSTSQNSPNNRFTFGDETLIQWGNRVQTRWSTDTTVTVGNANLVIQGQRKEVTHGSLQISNYAGVNFTAMNGGVEIGVAGGLASAYVEGFTWITSLGSNLTTHIYWGGMQAIGMGASILQSGRVQAALNKLTAGVKAAGVRIGSGVANILDGGLFGTPRV